MLNDHSFRRAAQRFVLVVGAGALGAAVCSTGARYAGPDEETLGSLRAGAATTPSSRPVDVAEAEALQLLRRAALAETATTYQGRKLLGSWSASGDESVLVDVSHVVGRGTRLRVSSAGIESRSGQSGDQEVEDASGELDQHALSLLTDQYSLRIGTSDRCLGRPATLVEATPVDGGAVAGRFWIDDASGLLLRRELYDTEGHTVRTTAFLDLEVNPAPVAALRTQSTAAAAPRSDSGAPAESADDGALDAAALDRLRDDGWVLPNALPAGMVLYRARAVDVPGGGRAVQLTYSDGLFALSMFTQRGRLDTSKLRNFTPTTVGGARVQSRAGLYRQVVWAGGDTVYTLVTDAPDADLELIVKVLPHTAPSTTMRSRIGRGIDRMGSWINPFE
jgi:sigma-E factor negative regulatory protein RseB